MEVTLLGDETESESDGSSDSNDSTSNDSDQESSAPSAPSFSLLTSDGELSSENEDFCTEEEQASIPPSAEPQPTSPKNPPKNPPL